METYTANQVVAVYIGLVLFGYIYDSYFVSTLALHLPPRYRRTSIEVVIGVSITLIGAGILFGIRDMLVLFLLFSGAGLFMIRGDFQRVEGSKA
jgi:hypothetical protein